MSFLPPIYPQFALVTALIAALGGCAAGPNFKSPDAPTVVSYGPDGMPVQTVETKTDKGGIQRFRAGGDIPAAWWALFESAPLNHLIQLAVDTNPTLDAARASLRSAEENVAAGESGFFPTVNGSATAQRGKSSGSSKPFSLYNTSVSVSYAPDVFGGTRRTVEALESAAQAKRFELEAAYLTLTSNVVTTAIQEASLRAIIAATKDIVADQEKQLGIIQVQYDVGAIPRQTLLAQETAVAASKATLPPLEQQLTANHNLMSVLLGQFPSQSLPSSFELTNLKLPAEIPVSLPSKLVEQRPDIRAARANLQGANAQIGIAMAAMLPQFPLSASLGVGASRMSGLFSPTTALWGLAGGIAQPLFRGGELLHNKQAKEADFDQAAAQYRSVVLAGFQDVADSLKALESDALTLKAQLEAERAAAETLDLTKQSYSAGAINYIALLSAQTTYQQAQIALIRAKAARLTDTVALFQSLGGGWWNRDADLMTKTTTKKM